MQPEASNGLRDPTHFYPVVLRPTKESDLEPRRGNLTPQQLKALRALVPPALGLGTGNCYAPGAPSRSKRGLIVRVNGKIEKLTGTPYGVVMTAHSYSARPKGFLAILPLLLDSEPDPGRDILVEHVKFDELEPGAESALMLVTGIYSVQKERQIERFTSLAIPSPQLHQAEEILASWLEVP